MTERSTIGRGFLAFFWNFEERRLRALWRLTGFGLIAIVLGRLAILAGFAGQLQGGHPELATLVTLVLMVSSLWLTARLFERRPLSDSGYVWNAAFRRELAFGLILGAVMMGSIFAAEAALGWVKITGYFKSGQPGVPFGVAFLTPIVVFVCVGIYEEAVTRGLLLRTLAEGFSSRLLPPRRALALAVLLQGALFGFGHRNNPNATAVSILNIAVAGIFLALPYLLTARMGFSIGLHTTWNLFQGNVFGFPVSGITSLPATVVVIEQKGPPVWTGGSFGPEGGLLCLLAMAIGSVVIFLLVRGPDGRAQIQESLAAPPARPAPPPLAPPGEPDRLTA
jgi:membrane protease YdiL (CAAX protease family)